MFFYLNESQLVVILVELFFLNCCFFLLSNTTPNFIQFTPFLAAICQLIWTVDPTSPCHLFAS